MSTPRLGKYGPCGEAIANILVDAFLPIVGSWPLSENGEIYRKFELDEYEIYQDLGWARSSDDELITTLPYNYGPVLPLGLWDVMHDLATIHGDPRLPKRYLNVEITIEMSAAEGAGGPTAWSTVDDNGDPLPDYGTTDPRTFTLIYVWDQEQDPDSYISFEMSLDSITSGPFWTWQRNSDGTTTETKTAAANALYNYSFGGQCSTENLRNALNLGGTATLTYTADGETGTMEADYTIPVGQPGVGTYYLYLTVEKSIQYAPEPGPTDDPPTWYSCHDEVVAILDDIDLSDPAKEYTFYDCEDGDGTPRTVTLQPRSMYYIIPFWKKNQTTGNNTTERLFDIIRIPLQTRFTCTSDESGSIWEGANDSWAPAGDGGLDSIGLGVSSWLDGRYSLYWLGIGWYGYDGVGGEWPEGFTTVPTGLDGQDGFFNGNMLMKLQRRVRTSDNVTQTLPRPSPPAWHLPSSIQRPTYHLTKANLYEETAADVCKITYAQNYGHVAYFWPTAAEPDDTGVATEDVAAINTCSGEQVIGNSALNWTNINPYPGNVDGGTMVLMRESQIAVTVSATDEPHCEVIDVEWDNKHYWPDCCGQESPLASDRSKLAEDQRML